MKSLVAAAMFLAGFGGAAERTAAKITKEQAQKIALERAPGGKVESSELEDEGGKSVWSFDLRVGKNLREIQVDSLTGEIASDKFETPKQEQDEKAHDKIEAAAKAKAAKDAKKRALKKKAPAK